MVSESDIEYIYIYIYISILYEKNNSDHFLFDSAIEFAGKNHGWKSKYYSKQNEHSVFQPFKPSFV